MRQCQPAESALIHAYEYISADNVRSYFVDWVRERSPKLKMCNMRDNEGEFAVLDSFHICALYSTEFIRGEFVEFQSFWVSSEVHFSNGDDSPFFDILICSLLR